MIYIIAGHSNSDSGAISNGLKEADLTKRIRDLIYTRIKELQPKALVTKDDDKDTLSQVIAKIKPRITAKDVLLDIHYNAATPKATGVECFVSDNASQKSKELAKEIAEITHKITGIKNRGVKKESQSARGGLGILNMKGTAVLWEVAFISNPSDVDKVETYLHWLCDEVARILLKAHG